MKLLSRALLFLALVGCLGWLAAPAALAQVTTGNIDGLVRAQEDGAALPGAVIQAVHEPTGTRYSAVTRADGSFRILNVRVGGPYTVTATMDGFAPQTVGDLFVKLGGTLDLAFQLQLATIEEVLTVVSSSDIINSSRTGAASNVGTEAIESLPTVSRGLEDFARTSPFMTVNSENEDPDAISVLGRSSRYNNIQIDGAVNNDLFGLADTGTPGGQAATNPISLDAIQEFQLVVSAFDVRQGGFSGGSINAITRSGGNNLAGSFFYFTRDDSFFGDGPDELGDFGNFEDDQYGFRLGGAIKKDKLFFFVNAEETDTSQPTGFSIDGSSGQVFAGGVQNTATRFRNFLIDNYGFDPGGFAANIRDTPSTNIFGRLDFNIQDKHQLTVRHNFVDAQNDINRPSSFVYEFPSETYQFDNETNSTVVQLNSTLGSDKFNELRVGFQTIKDRRGDHDGIIFPWIEIEDIDPAGREFEAGTEPFSTRNALDQDILEITDDFTWLKGNHTLTFGTHNELFSFDNLFIQNAFGAYEFVDLDQFESGFARRWSFTVIPEGQPPSQKFDVNQLGLYFGDEWRMKSNLTLLFGLRVDAPFFPDSPSRNPFTEATYGFRTDELPDGEPLWQPRFGFNWDINNDGKQQLRGGAGIFAGRTPYVWISNSYARTGLEQIFVQCFNVPFNPDPFGQDPSCASRGQIGEFNLIDPNFEFPQVARYNLAYDRELPWLGLVGSVEVIHSQSVKEIDYRNVNLRRTGQVIPFDGRPIFEEVDRGVDGAYLITNTNDGESTNIALKIEKPFRGAWSGYVSYVYGDAKVVNEGSSSRAVSNWQFNEAVDPNNAGLSASDFEVEDRFTASLTYRFNRDKQYSTTVSAYYNLQSGRPFSYLLEDDFRASPNSINGDGFDSNDLFYVPAGPNDVVFDLRGSETQEGQWAILDAFISADACLDSHRGKIAPRNCSKAPWNHTLDVHVAQDIPMPKGNLQLTFDILNLMNLIDEDSGVLRFVNFNSLDLASFKGVTADGKPIYDLFSTVDDPDARWDIHNIRSRWRAKVGVRWSF